MNILPILEYPDKRLRTVAEPVVEKPAAKPAAAKGALPKDTAGIIAYCQKKDGK